MTQLTSLTGRSWLSSVWAPWVSGVVIAGVIIWSQSLGLLTGPVALTESLVLPVQHLATDVGRAITQPVEYSLSLTRAQRRIQELETRYAAVAAELTELSGLEEENQELRLLLQAAAPDQPRVVTAPVLGLNQAWLSAGSTQGVALDQPVLVSQTLVGVISQVLPRQSRVSLLTDAQGVRIVLRTEAGVEGLSKGDGQRLYLTEISRDANLTVGERVWTKGQPGVPPNLFVGEISRITADPASPVQTVLIEAGVSFFTTRVVEVRL